MPGTMISYLIDERFTCKIACIHIAFSDVRMIRMSRNDNQGCDQKKKKLTYLFHYPCRHATTH